jgi:DNA-binding transcriptional MerR regulator
MSKNHGQLPDVYTTKEVVKLSGLSKTTLDYLVRSGLSVPSRSKKKGKRGAPRLYSFGDIVTLRAIKELLEAGISVIQLRRSLNRLFVGKNEITVGKIPSKYLVTDGKDLYYWDKDEVLENLSCGGQLAFAFIIDIVPVHERLVNDITNTLLRETA